MEKKSDVLMNGRGGINKLMLQGDRYWLNIKKYCLSELRVGGYGGVPHLGKFKYSLGNHWCGC